MVNPKFAPMSLQSNLVNRGAIASVRIKRVEFRENVRALFPPGTKKTVLNSKVSL